MRLLALMSVVAFAGCGAGNGTKAESLGVADPDLSALTDNFDDPKSLKSWKFVHETEDLGNRPIETFEVKQKGWLTLIPRTSTWYRDYRGALAYKEVTGDFMVTTHLRVSGRSGTGAPKSQFSLAGLMIRTPQGVDRGTWRPGRENYVFLSVGSADQAGKWQHEVKTTVNSDSQLRTWPTSNGETSLRITRKGAQVTLATNDGSGWRVQQQYSRDDMPRTVQVGLCCYTDWPNASRLQPDQHNATTIRDGNPDLVALVDYVRFERP